MVQITNRGVVVSGLAQKVECLRAEFEATNCARLRNFLEPGLLHYMQERISRACFYERNDNDIAAELCMGDDVSFGVLYLLTNNSTLFSAIRKITGCGEIGSVRGRIYRFMPGPSHHDSWHDDRGDNARMIGISINLSDGPFSGGLLQIRERESLRITAEVSNTGPGDAVIFRLGGDIEHRVTCVEGHIPRTAFAGWFQSQPDFREILRRGMSL